jgi:hypothetical protein
VPPTPIGELHPDEDDDDDEEVEEMLQHPDRRLAAAGFRVPRSVGAARPLVIEDARLLAIPKSISPIERHAVNPNEPTQLDDWDSLTPIGHSAPVPPTTIGADDEVGQDPLLAEAGIRVRRGTGAR